MKRGRCWQNEKNILWRLKLALSIPHDVYYAGPLAEECVDDRGP